MAGWSLVGAHWGPPPSGIQPGGAPTGAISVDDLSREELVGDSSGEKKREREEREGAIEELLQSDNCVGGSPMWTGLVREVVESLGFAKSIGSERSHGRM